MSTIAYNTIRITTVEHRVMNEQNTENTPTKEAYEKPQVQTLKLDQVIRGGGGSALDADNTLSLPGGAAL